MKLLILTSICILMSIACANETKPENEPQNDEVKEEFTLFKLLGKDLEDDEVVDFQNPLGNPVAEEAGKYPHIMYYAGGVEMVYESKTNKVASIFLMGPENKYYQIYKGTLPDGINWDMNRAEVEEKLGKGERRKTYGGEVVFMYKEMFFEIKYNTLDDTNMDAQLKSVLITDFDD